MNIINREDLLVRQLQNQHTGQLSYIVQSGAEAAVIDPVVDNSHIYTYYVDREVQQKCAITTILLTHPQEDFKAGFLELAPKTEIGEIEESERANAINAALVSSANDQQVTALGDLYQIRRLFTPGSSTQSGCYVLEAKETQEPVCVFTGDTLFLKDVGRPWLHEDGGLNQEEAGNPDELATALFNSLNSLQQLHSSTSYLILPGYFLGSKDTDQSLYSTFLDILTHNGPFQSAIAADGQEKFLEIVKDKENVPLFNNGQEKIRRMNKENREVYLTQAIEKAFQKITPEQVKAFIEDPEVVIIDTRPTPDFDAGHIESSLFIPGAGPSFGMWVTYLVKPEEGIVLVTKQGLEKEMVEKLVRSGFANIIGYVDGGFQQWAELYPERVGTIETIKFANAEELHSQIEDFEVIDVRGLGEQEKKGILDFDNTNLLGLVRIKNVLDEKALAEIEASGKKIGAHCGGGTRARIGIAYLRSKGISNKLYNLDGGFKGFLKAGAKTANISKGKRCTLI